MSGGGTRGLFGISIDTHDIAAHLQQSVLVPEQVVDRRVFSGLFDGTVTWRRSAVNAQRNLSGPKGGQVANPDGADVFTDLPEQIGLRLERQRVRAPRDRNGLP